MEDTEHVPGYRLVTLDFRGRPVVSLHHHRAMHQIPDAGAEHRYVHVPIILGPVCNLFLIIKSAPSVLQQILFTISVRADVLIITVLLCAQVLLVSMTCTYRKF
jgi:hypothetical protein